MNTLGGMLMLDVIINYAYIIFVPIIAIAGTIWYMKSHTTISTGPEGELNGCFGVFITFGIVGAIIVTFAIYALSWCVGFFLEYWKWFAGGAGVLLALIYWGGKQSETSEEKKEAQQE